MDKARAKELINEFRAHGISHEHGNGLEHVLAFQDVIGRANLADLADFEAGLEHDDRRIWTWAILHTLDMDMAMNLIRDTTISRVARKQREADEKHHMERETALYMRERAFEDSKRAIWKRIRTERERADLAERRATVRQADKDYLAGELARLRVKCQELEEDARRFQAIKGLLT